MVGVTIGIRNDMEVKRFDKIKDHVEIDMERKDGSQVLLTFTALEIAFMYYELRDLQIQVSNTDLLHNVSQRSELLIDYMKWFDDNRDMYYEVSNKEMITKYIESINCG